MRKAITYLVVFLALLTGPTIIRYLGTYRLSRPERTVPVYTPDVPEVPTPASKDFMDEPQEGEGLVLLDLAHGNDFTMDEIGYLDGRLAARGYELLPYYGGDMAVALRAVDSFVVIAPLFSFTQDEVQAVTQFVEKGGRLLMVGDPTRFNLLFDEEDFFAPPELQNDQIPLNSLSNAFDIVFNGDYLYNTLENEGNFRNIIISGAGFAEDSLTDGLEKVVFYGSHSLQVGASAEPLLLGDENTWSSATDRPGELVLAALGGNGRALALGDINFLMEPYYTVYDNGRFIAQIANFLTDTSQRQFTLSDFPYFFDKNINLVYLGQPDLGPNVFDEIIALQEAFRRVGQNLTLAGSIDKAEQGLFVGLYNQADDIADILAEANITLVIDPPITTEEQTQTEPEPEAEATPEPIPTAEPESEETPPPTETETTPQETIRLIQSDLGSIQMSGTALILLDESSGDKRVIVLAASSAGLENAVNRLLNLIPLNADYALADCLLQGALALCPTDIPDEEVEAELLAGGEPVQLETTPTPDGESDLSGSGAPVESPAEIDAVNQGSVILDTAVSGELGVGESHAWTFEEGPAIIDITVTGDDNMDTVLELYDPDNILIATADNTFAAGTEELLGIEVSTGRYTIVIRDFFGDGGSYTLTVSSTPIETSPEEGSSPPNENGTDVTGLNILVYGDDMGTAYGDGLTDIDRFTELLADSHTVTTWLGSTDGDLTPDLLDGIDLLVWDSGDFMDENGFIEDDTFLILDFLDAGGELIVTGGTPSLFGGFSELDVSVISDLELAGDDVTLLANLNAGDVIALTAPFTAMTGETLAEDFGEEVTLFAVRGPESEFSGNVVGFAVDDSTTSQRAVFLLLPFRALPESLQPVLLTNLVNWLYQDSTAG
ncbi:MAG: hypothetical protein Kow0080_14220 [Candidatus Promineifilaceae bacterium]